MKIIDILQHESNNKENILLFKEGMFLRAYEQSAMRFVENIADFKVFKKHYKVVDKEVCYLGFPYSNLKILVEKVMIDISSIIETSEFVIIPQCNSSNNFEVWKSKIPLPSMKQLEHKALFRENVKPKKYNNLTIYKAGYDIMLEIHRFVDLMPRRNKYTVGERMKNESIELAVAAYKIGCNSNNYLNYEIGREKIEIIRLLLRLLKDLKEISMRSFIRLNTQLEYLYIEYTK